MKLPKGKTLNNIIKQRGYTIKEFCAMTEISEASFYAYLSGKIDPTAKKLIIMASTLKISLKQLLLYLGKDITGIPNDE